MSMNLMIQEHVRERMESPTPDWLDALVRWALQGVPQLVQKLGGVVGAVIIIALALLVLWRRRQIAAWWGRRGPRFKWGLVGVAGVFLITGAAMGAYLWNYMQTDNDFCNSCHVMNEPFERFQSSEHSELKCHDCHQQSIFASARQLYLWVENRPEEIGDHAPVPIGVCAECHITQDPDSTWQRISATAGHRVHLEADTSALQDVTCVTCHGQEVHKFVPVDQTCGQSGCHDPDKTEVVLGEMAGQTGFHCVMCHEFTAPVAEEVPLDTARAALVPELENCRSCHEMEKVLAGLVDPNVDPHDAICGTCHNPHTQEAPSEAINRCAECHAPADTLTPFHRGLRAGVLEDCIGCHASHTFVVEGKNCVACHADIIGGTPTAGPRARPPKDVTATPPLGPRVRLVSTTGSARRAPGPEVAIEYVRMRRASGAEALRGGVPQQQRINHRDHRDVPCTDCHTSRETHGQVTIESGVACQQCHHARPVVDRGCARCHGRAELSAGVPITIRMDLTRRAVDRQVRFDHDNHAGLGCAQCHTQGVSMRVERTCASCHQSHHTATASCVTCHNQPNRASHTAQVHTRTCAGSSCHESASYGAMAEGRNTCLVCHQDQTDHKPGQACAACHRVTFSALDVRAGDAGAR
jgi:nitrate/TMAO reductase-like tetraheme cytochrome c subunit